MELERQVRELRELWIRQQKQVDDCVDRCEENAQEIHDQGLTFELRDAETGGIMGDMIASNQELQGLRQRIERIESRLNIN